MGTAEQQRVGLGMGVAARYEPVETMSPIDDFK
jgi:hypothetical protein